LPTAFATARMLLGMLIYTISCQSLFPAPAAQTASFMQLDYTIPAGWAQGFAPSDECAKPSHHPPHERQTVARRDSDDESSGRRGAHGSNFSGPSPENSQRCCVAADEKHPSGTDRRHEPLRGLPIAPTRPDSARGDSRPRQKPPARRFDSR